MPVADPSTTGYSPERPELFFKAIGQRVIGPGGKVRIRSDARWSVPEPELTLMVSAAGEIVGYTIGNDMSSRDIEGENPLYLPQARFTTEAALGPCVLLSEKLMPVSTVIRIEIARNRKIEFEGTTTLAELKRDPKELVSFLFRDNSFPLGRLPDDRDRNRARGRLHPCARRRHSNRDCRNWGTGKCSRSVRNTRSPNVVSELKVPIIQPF